MIRTMGNREQLLDGAKRCLYEKGYARTTARDIATAAGTSLAAIGYHFGSTEALLNAALFEAVAEWGEELSRALAAPSDNTGGRFESIWSRVIESFTTQRPLWSTQFELIGLMEHLPTVREFSVQAQRHGRAELVSMFQPPDAD